MLSFEYLFTVIQWSTDSLLISWLYPALEQLGDNTFFSPLTSKLQLPGQGNTNHIELGQAVPRQGCLCVCKRPQSCGWSFRRGNELSEATGIHHLQLIEPW